MAVAIMVSCKDQNDIYKDYMPLNGIVYPGKATGAIACSGYEKVEIRWPAGADPSVVSAKISWNNNLGDTVVSIPPNTDTIRCLIPLPEGSHAFEIRTCDAKGNVSVPVEITGRAYGSVYVNRFVVPREIESQKIDGTKATILWKSADISNGARYTEVNYPALDETEKTVTLSALETILEIEDFKLGAGGFKHRTVYLPDSTSIDPLFSTKRTVDEYFALDKKNCHVVDFSSQHPDGNNFASNVIDGIYLDNRWHTNANIPGVYPHFVTIRFDTETSIQCVGVWPSTRDAVNRGGVIDERLPTSLKFEISQDNASWTSVGQFTSPLPTTHSEQRYEVTPTPARYIKFTGISTTNPNNDVGYMVVGELDFYCK